MEEIDLYDFLLEGDNRGDIHLLQGDVVFVPADVEHEYANAGDTTFRFLCGIPVTKLRPRP